MSCCLGATSGAGVGRGPHVWLWLQTTPGRLRDEVRELLADPANTLLLSAASSWEIAIEYRLGRLPLPQPPAEYVPDRRRGRPVGGRPRHRDHARSNRSRFMTLSHAATKSRMNFSFPSSAA